MPDRITELDLIEKEKQIEETQLYNYNAAWMEAMKQVEAGKLKSRRETNTEHSRRLYWSRKLDMRFYKLEFFRKYPLLSKKTDNLPQTADEIISLYFVPRAPKKREANKYRKERRVLKANDFVRCIILEGQFAGRDGIITMVSSIGYRVTIRPKHRWQNNIRRWYSPELVKAKEGYTLPHL